MFSSLAWYISVHCGISLSIAHPKSQEVKTHRLRPWQNFQLNALFQFEIRVKSIPLLESDSFYCFQYFFR